MHTDKQVRSSDDTPTLPTVLLRAFILLLPGALLLVAVGRTLGHPQAMLVLGAAFQVIVCCFTFVTQKSWREPIGPSIITLYLIGLGWLWLGASQLDDWYPHLAEAILLIVPLTVFAVQTLTRSGAPALRRAQVLAQRLANRKEWPADLCACGNLPEVKALREALHLDATPALVLLQHPRLPVRVAALAALEFRKNWRPGQADLVLQVAQKAPEPEVRAAAIMALANVEDRLLVESIADFLRDSSWEVRRAATEALLWDSEHRWTWIRHAVRQNLGDATFHEDGPLQYEGQFLTPDAIADLNAWASEKGSLAVRAAQTLGLHYSRALTERQEDGLIRELQDRLADPHAPAALRIEIARLLQNCTQWSKQLLENLLSPSNPAPLRLLAAEALLHDGEHQQALAAIHDIARLPNREIALATAGVVQRRLGVDLGLPIGQPLPPLHSRQAAEVTRRVMLWAAQVQEPEFRNQQTEGNSQESEGEGQRIVVE